MFKWIANSWQRWRLKISISIIEQGVFSGGNFIFNILLGRWLLPAEYGVFAIGFSVFLFLSGFYQALIFDPMGVIGAANHRDNLNKYMGAAVYAHWGLSLLFLLLILFIAIVMYLMKNTFAFLFLCLAFASPLILFLWFFRYASYLQIKPQAALKSSLLYIFFLFLGLFILRKKNFLTPISALSIMSLASIGASLILWKNLGITMPKFSWQEGKNNIRAIFMENWQYGKWIFGSAFVNWLSILIYLPAVGFLVGLSQAGGLKAMQNTILPLEQTVIVLTLLFIPWLSREKQIKAKGYLKEKMYRFIGLGSLFSFIYVAVIVLAGPLIIKLFYGQASYADFLWLLPFLGGVAFLQCIIRMLGVALKVLQRPSAIFLAQTAGAVFTLSVSLYLIIKLGLYGAVMGLFASALLIAIVLACFFFRYLKQHEEQFLL